MWGAYFLYNANGYCNQNWCLASLGAYFLWMPIILNIQYDSHYTIALMYSDFWGFVEPSCSGEAKPFLLPLLHFICIPMHTNLSLVTFLPHRGWTWLWTWSWSALCLISNYLTHLQKKQIVAGTFWWLLLLFCGYLGWYSGSLWQWWCLTLRMAVSGPLVLSHHILALLSFSYVSSLWGAQVILVCFAVCKVCWEPAKLFIWQSDHVAFTKFPTSQNFYEGDMCRYREHWTHVNSHSCPNCKLMPVPLSISHFHFFWRCSTTIDTVTTLTMHDPSPGETTN